MRRRRVCSGGSVSSIDRRASRASSSRSQRLMWPTADENVARVLRDRDDVVVLRDRPEAAASPTPTGASEPGRARAAARSDRAGSRPRRPRGSRCRFPRAPRRPPSSAVPRDRGRGAPEPEPERPRRLDVAHHRVPCRLGSAGRDRRARSRDARRPRARGSTAGPCRASRSGTRPRGSPPPGRRAAPSRRRRQRARWKRLSRSLQGSNSSIDSISSTSEPRYVELLRRRPLGGERRRAALDDDAVVDEVAQVGLGRDGAAHGEPCRGWRSRSCRRRGRAASRRAPPRAGSRSRCEASPARCRGRRRAAPRAAAGRRAAAAPSRSPGRAARPSRRRRCPRVRACRPSARRGAERGRRAGS